MAVYQNGGGNSLHSLQLSANRLPAPLMCGPQPPTTSPPHPSTFEPQLSPLDPPSQLDPPLRLQKLSPLSPLGTKKTRTRPLSTISQPELRSKPASARLSRRGTEVSLGHVKLQDSYINIEVQRESEKQLTEAWKRKRRRSVESRREYLKSAPLTRVKHPLEESVVLAFLSNFLSVLVTCVISVPLTLLLLILLPISVFLKALVSICRFPFSCNCKREYLSPHDAQFLLHDAESQAVIHSVLIIDAAMSLKRIKQLVASRVVDAKSGSGELMYPRLTQIVSELPGGPAWITDHKFSLHNHIFTGPTVGTEDALQKYVSSLLSQPLPMSRPLWEIIVLHDYGRSHDTVLVARAHQCLSDGISLLRVLCQSLSDNQIMHIPQKPHFGGQTYSMNILRALLVGPITSLIWLLVWKTQLNPFTIRRRETLRVRRNPCCGCSRAVSASSTDGGAYTVWSEGVGGQEVIWSSGIAVNDVVRIKQVTRTCLNDVLLAALSGALRITLQRRGVVHPPDLRINIAVDLRSSSQPFTLPHMGTKSTLSPLTLPLTVDAAIPRLWEIRSRMDEMKASAEPVISYGIVWLAMKLFPVNWTRVFIERLQSRSSLQYSSLPGPNNSLLLGGYTVKNMYNVSPPRCPTPLSVTMLTYADRLHVCVCVRKSLPGAHTIIRCIVAEFEKQCIQMSELLSNRRIPGEQRRNIMYSVGELSNVQTLTDLQDKLRRVQTELQIVTQQCEIVKLQQSQQENDTAENITSETNLLSRARNKSVNNRQDELGLKIQQLKDQFTDLLTEIRRRKSLTEGRTVVGVAIQTELEEDDCEFRKPRKRALSATSTFSASSTSSSEHSSCVNRPLTTHTNIHNITHTKSLLVTDIS